MINFRTEANLLILIYTPRDEATWIDKHFEKKDWLTIKKTFHFEEKDRHFQDNDEEDSFDLSEEEAEFVIGTLIGDYFRIEKKVLGINNDVYIYKENKPREKYFIAKKGISVFQSIDRLSNEDIYIGGNHEHAIPITEFEKLIHNFPNDYELRRYADARISTILRNYFDTAIDGEGRYNRYMNKKVSQIGQNLSDIFRESELWKFEAILGKLKNMLETENSYNEHQWQKEILQIILLLYPKYLYVFDGVPIMDTYSDKNRELDFLLVDSSGNADIIEIKRPFDNCIISHNVYRDNYIPVKELSGTVMQIEKYIFYLNKWGKKGEDELTKRYKEKLPGDFRVMITNPKGIIIMGRENNLTIPQKKDFEIIKRKYSNIIDIITYDDLIKRLEVTIEKFKQPKPLNE